MSSRCFSDYIELFDGRTIQYGSMGRYCGDMLTPISSSQRYLTIHFVTDNENQYSGFKLHYNFTSECTYPLVLP